jgi:site-specific DNA-methyltransferase (adenine-specific)
MNTPYYEDESVTLHLGDMREILPALGLRADCIVTDPPYADTHHLTWDRWPDGWPTLAAAVANSMWCFGSMRMFLNRSPEFTDWKLSQDVVWKKNAGTGFAADRFRRVHEHALHWYRGEWNAIHHDAVRVAHRGRNEGAVRRTVTSGMHTGEIGKADWVDDGTRLATSVIDVKNLRGHAVHPTQKPSGILQPLIQYACPPGGLVVDPFAGSGSTLMTARMIGRRSVGIEADEKYCELAAQRLSHLTLEAS